MKKFLLIIALFIFMGNAKAQDGIKDGEMKKYFFVFLKSGPNKDYSDTAKMRKYQEGHMNNIKRMADMGKVHIAGPFLDKTELRGIFIMDVKDEDEIKELLQEDVYIQEGYLIYEVHPWYSMKGASLK
ncbi:MAG: hypothetical protein JSS63_07100 [Bacteroidetes bacterium]|nr:hypothetical protein [Bacteroidota bacterium]